MLMALSSETLAYFIHALREHELTYRKNGMAVPSGVAEAVAQLSSGVIEGQAGSSSAGSVRTEQIEVMKPRLVTYDTAAELLAISVSTLKRQIRDGVFHPVSIGGASRIRVAEIDDLANSGAQPVDSKAGN
jgi:excisionase family DNA binding protein